jgi:hypothetical protein
MLRATPCKALQKGIDLCALDSSVHSLGIYITLPYVAYNVATIDGISYIAFPVMRLFIDNIKLYYSQPNLKFSLICKFTA